MAFDTALPTSSEAVSRDIGLFEMTAMFSSIFSISTEAESCLLINWGKSVSIVPVGDSKHLH